MIQLKEKLPFIALMLSLFSFWQCKSARPVATPAQFDWQGHRGCRGILPENAVPAFLRALEFPEVRTLELDLAVSKDGRLIVSHEPWFNPAICRRANGDSIARSEGERLLIYQMTLDEIRAFDCGSKGNPRFPDQEKMKTHKPTLREVVEAVRAKYPDRPVRWNMEIKSSPEWDGIRTPPIEDFARMVVDELKQLGLLESTVVQSFDVRALQAMRRIAPDVRLALLIENIRGFDYNIEKLGFKPAIYSPYYQVVGKKLVRKCHSNGVQIIPWTVNDVNAMRKLIRIGVDGIITDYPNRIGEVGER